VSAAGKDGVRGNPGKSVFGRRAGLASLSSPSDFHHGLLTPRCSGLALLAAERQRLAQRRTRRTRDGNRGPGRHERGA
jgi:hypothetical protein